MSKTDVKDLMKFFVLAGVSIWGWKEISKRNTTVRDLMTR